MKAHDCHSVSSIQMRLSLRVLCLLRSSVFRAVCCTLALLTLALLTNINPSCRPHLGARHKRRTPQAEVQSDAEGVDPLAAAVSGGHEGVVELLLHRSYSGKLQPPVCFGSDLIDVAAAADEEAIEQVRHTWPERAPRGRSVRHVAGACVACVFPFLSPGACTLAPHPTLLTRPSANPTQSLRNPSANPTQALRRYLSQTWAAAAQHAAAQHALLKERTAPLLGEQVELRELVGKPHLNGARGEAREYDNASGRYRVVLAADGGTLEVRPQNLLHVEPANGKATGAVRVREGKGKGGAAKKGKGRAAAETAESAGADKPRAAAAANGASSSVSAVSAVSASTAPRVVGGGTLPTLDEQGRDGRGYPVWHRAPGWLSAEGATRRVCSHSNDEPPV